MDALYFVMKFCREKHAIIKKKIHIPYILKNTLKRNLKHFNLIFYIFQMPIFLLNYHFMHSLSLSGLNRLQEIKKKKLRVPRYEVKILGQFGQNTEY